MDITEITEIVPQFDARVERRANTYTDTHDPARERVVRVWDVEPIPVGEVQAVRREAVFAERRRRLNAIDALTIRPLRAVAAGSAQQADRDRLAELEAQALAVRGHADHLLSAIDGAADVAEVLAIDLTAVWG